jgi:hypothetical protein
MAILEYQYGHVFGKAIKVERNQPLITKFYKPINLNLKQLPFYYSQCSYFRKINWYYNFESKEPVSRVIVLVSQEEQQVAFGSTNTDGVFIKSLPSGTYTITLKKLGFSAGGANYNRERCLINFEMLPN